MVYVRGWAGDKFRNQWNLDESQSLTLEKINYREMKNEKDKRGKD